MPESSAEKKPSKKEPAKLGQFASTAVAGNDILSSALYVSGIAILFAGVFAPVIFLVIVLVLWLYKHVYTEVVEALPLNGGAYNCLLNATSKTVASIAGVMTILSYVATSVISAKTASEYLHTVVTGLPVLAVTAGIIIFFACLVIAGVKDSAKVAMGIFLFHLVTLGIFVCLGVLQIALHGAGFLPANFIDTIAFFRSSSQLNLMGNFQLILGGSKMLFLAFAASLLGVSGFESSANFVEEQHKGVFRKTLRNMLIGVLVFNPLIALVVLQSMPLAQIALSKDYILADVARNLGGQPFQYFLVADAFLVLAGAVLTSFIGASGLIYRMTLDHCLPSSILLPKLKHRNTNVSRIIVAFSVLCLSILFLTGGNLLSLAGVYTISFLGVMTLFAIGNLVLRLTRPDLKRTYQGPLLYVILAMLATIAGIIGNILIDPRNLLFFILYFLPTISVVFAMIYRDLVLEAVLRMTKRSPYLYRKVKPWFDQMIKPKIILFSHSPDKLYSALLYIDKNEISRNIIVVHCLENEDHDHPKNYNAVFTSYIKLFSEAKIFPHFNIDFLIESDDHFGPETVKKYANRYRISLNNVFVGSIDKSFDFNFDEFGGVRIIQ